MSTHRWLYRSGSRRAFALVLLTLPAFDHPSPFNLSSRGPLVILTRMAPGHLAIPGRIMRPRPPLAYSAARHRMKSARQRRRAFVDVNDEAAEHDECRDVVEEIRNPHQHATEDLRPPHQESSDEEDD